jgi:hypothetical protein
VLHYEEIELHDREQSLFMQQYHLYIFTKSMRLYPQKIIDRWKEVSKGGDPMKG